MVIICQTSVTCPELHWVNDRQPPPPTKIRKILRVISMLQGKKPSTELIVSWNLKLCLSPVRITLTHSTVLWEKQGTLPTGNGLGASCLPKRLVALCKILLKVAISPAIYQVPRDSLSMSDWTRLPLYDTFLAMTPLHFSPRSDVTMKSHCRLWKVGGKTK